MKRTILASAGIELVDRDSRFAMLYGAARKAADAAMRAEGRRVTELELADLADAAAKIVAAARRHLQ